MAYYYFGMVNENQKGVILSMDSSKRVLVCVTQQKTCERLIKKGASIGNEIGGELFIIHSAKNGFNFLGNSKEGEALEYLFGISKSVGAELNVLRSDDIVKTITGFAKENRITNLILGESPGEGNSDIINNIKKKLSTVDIYIMPYDEDAKDSN
jgi:K+-sensing histidine kinase KdpD